MSNLDGPIYTIWSKGKGIDQWTAMAPIPKHRWINIQREYAGRWNTKPEQIKITETMTIPPNKYTYVVFERQDRMATFGTKMKLKHSELLKKAAEYAHMWNTPQTHITICPVDNATDTARRLREKWKLAPTAKNLCYAYAVRYKGRHIEKFTSRTKLTDEQIAARKRAYAAEYGYNVPFLSIYRLEDAE